MEDEVGESCGTHGRDEECMGNFVKKIWKEEFTQKIQA